MRRTRALLLAALALLATAPAQAASEPTPAFPADLVALGAKWIERSEALAAPYANATWIGPSQEFLQKARDANREGRLRTVMFHLETHAELLHGDRLYAEGTSNGSLSRSRGLVIDATTRFADASNASWREFRAELKGLDGELRSLQALELAMYAADVALTGALLLEQHDDYVRAYAAESGFDRAFVLGIVRASYTPGLAVGYAEDILEVAKAREGLAPRLKTDKLEEFTAAALAIDPTQYPPTFTSMRSVGGPIRAGGEGIMTLTLWLAENRLSRETTMSQIFGDAAGRRDTESDSARGMRNQLANTSVEMATRLGATGVFTSDAIDRATLTVDIANQNMATLGIIISAWGALEHEKFVRAFLGAITTVVPPPTPENKAGTPLPALVGVAALAVGAWGAKRRRR